MTAINRIIDITPARRGFGLITDEELRNPASAAGVAVTSNNAFLSTHVLACVRVLAEGVASLPCHYFRRLANGGKERQPGALDRLLSVQANEWQTAYEWKEMSMIHLGLWGEAYSRIITKGSEVVALIPMHPSRMDVEQLPNNRLRFWYTDNVGRRIPLTQDEVWRAVWMSQDGIRGSVPIKCGREAIALARACEMHGARFFGAGARPGVVLETDGTVDAETALELRDNWERMHRGPDRSHRTAILTGGLKAHELGTTNTDSQFLEARRFQSEEICRLYRVAPHLVQDLSRATFSNIEQQSIDFVQFTLLPWVRRLESSFARDLIVNNDTNFAEFDLRGLLRGDSVARMNYYTSGIDRGIFSINEVRGFENMNPIEGGEVHHFPLNMTTVEEVTNEPDADDTGDQGGDTTQADGKQADGDQGNGKQAGDAGTTPDAATTVETNFAAAALNGAQVTSLLEIVNCLIDGSLTPAGGAAVIGAAFPQLTAEQIKAIIDGVNLDAKPKNDTPPPPPPPAGEPPAKTDPNDDPKSKKEPKDGEPDANE
jgi:HK97 family phage portal protein